MRPGVWGLGLLLAGVLAVGQQRSFVACPIVRDTKTVPCFLAEYDGETYFLGVQQEAPGELHAPQLKHEVLVEGGVAPGPRVCGGIPLEPLSISVLKEVNLSCNTLLPAETGIEAPSTEPRGSANGTSKSPAGPQEFSILYAFDDDILDYSGTQAIMDAAEYARRIGASTVKVGGYRATTLLSNGNRLVEKAGIAEKRAENIVMLLRGLGVTGVTVEWKDEAEPGDGKTDAAHRRVSILITR